MSRHFSAILIFVCISGNVNSQVIFQKTYGDALSDFGYSIQQTSDGGYIITGSTEIATGIPYSEVYLIKTNSAGDTLWTKIFGGSNVDYGYSVQQTADGGYIIAGYTLSFGTSTYDIYLLKTDVDGNPEWSKTLDGFDDDYGYWIEQTNDGGYIISGYFDSSFGTGPDVYLIKTDDSGSAAWTKTFGGTSIDYGYCVRQTMDGGYIIAGYSLSFGGNVYLIKTDVAGDTLWTKSYGGTGGEIGRCVYQTFDHGYIIAGNTNSFGAGNQDFYLIKTDSNGTLTWSKTYGGEDYESATSVQQTNDGGYIVTGPMQTTFDMDSSDVMLLRTDSDGDVLWANTYGGLHGDYAREVEQTADGGFIVSGYSNSYGAGGFDVYLIKTDATGNSGCNQSVMTPMVTTPSTQSSGTATLLPAVGMIEDTPSTISGSGSTVTPLCLATATDEDTGEKS